MGVRSGDLESIKQWIPMDNFRFWCQKVLPLVFDDSISYYETLCKLAKSLNEVINNVEYLNQQIGESGLEELIQQVQDMQDELDAIKDGEYVDNYIDQLARWIDNNLQQLVGRVMKFVNFGLSSDGYFVAYIPESWQFISFDTVVDPESPAYGHLIVRW